MTPRSILIGGGTLIFGLLLSAQGRGGEKVDFTTQVRPILSQHCFKCHGQDADARKGSLRLDREEGAYAEGDSGERGIVPGKPDDSELIRRIFSGEEAEVMPPPSTKNPLTQAQKEILKQWIAEGAVYKPHWAFQPPRETPFPTLRRQEWPRNEIDHFILSKLEAQGLQPAPEADRATLVRRVSLDLIGLPPTPEEADAFIHDPDPRAYEKLVDHLLNSPHYGERWARKWLDLARYADTNGYEKDRQRSIWAYRDWVIEALNNDLPFDQFTIEQLAGDMLPNATLSQKIATGFHRNTMLNEEGGIDPLEFRFYAMVDRMNTTSTAWLGLTMGCAVCHTHKYDPIEQREYYQMLAFLNNADEPRIDIPQTEITRQREEIQQQIRDHEARLIDQFPAENPEVRWTTPRPVEVADNTGLPQIELLEDRSVLMLDRNPEKSDYSVVFETRAGTFDSLKLEVLIHSRIPGNGPGRTPHGNLVLSEISLTAAPLDRPEQAENVAFASATADHSQAGFEIDKALDGKPETGWGIDEKEKTHQNRSAIFSLVKPTGFPQGTRWTVSLKQQHGSQHTLGRFRLSLGERNSTATALDSQQHFERKFEEWLNDETEHLVEWSPLTPVQATSNLPLLTIQPDGTILSRGDQTKRDLYEIRLQGDLEGVTAIRLDVLPDEGLPEHGPGRVFYEGPFGDFHLSEITAEQAKQPLTFSGATHSFAATSFTAKEALDQNPQTAWSINGGQGAAHYAVFNFAQPLSSSDELTVRLLFEKYYSAGIGKFRFQATKDMTRVRARGYPDAVEQALRQTSARSPELRDQLRRYFASVAPELETQRQELDRLRNSIPKYPTTLVMEERPADNPRPTFIHKRGEFLQPTVQVQPVGLSILPPFPEQASRDRLNFARWLVDGRNPLVGRVVMNRHWGTLFGQALVRTTEDFGLQGEAPSHPELLDWLALRFVRENWSVKQMHKLMVMSATYRQSSVVTPEKLAADPTNKWLSRAPRFRLEAELVRDAALRMSGLLSEKIGGPSVFPPQPPGVSTEGAYGGLSWTVSTGDDRYRRGLYTFTKRTAPYAMFATFDAPSGEACVPRRDVTNTPLQALTILNDSVFVEAAQKLGSTMTADSRDQAEKIRELTRRILTREPTTDEIGLLTEFHRHQIERLKNNELDPGKIAGPGEGDPIERAAWTLTARTLLNLDETFTKE